MELTDEVTDEDREYIATQIQAGFNEGMTGSEAEDGDIVRISWKLTVNKWKE